MDKENVIHDRQSHTIEYYSVIKKGNSAICDSMDEPWGRYAKWNKSDIKRQILYDLTYMQNLKKDTQKHRD